MTPNHKPKAQRVSSNKNKTKQNINPKQTKETQ